MFREPKLQSPADLEQASAELVERTKEGGAPDNVTVVVAHVVDADVSSVQPIVAGAAAESPQEAPAGIADSAASRARVAEGRDTAPAPRAAEAPPAGRGHRRTVFVLVGVLVLLVATASAGYAYVRSQFYVGLDGNKVAVFRGVSGNLAGLSLHTVEEKTSLSADTLSEVEQARLADGIVAVDQRDARAIVSRLISSAGCVLVPTPVPTVVTPSARPNPVPRPAVTPSVPATTAPNVTPTPALCP